MKKSSCHWRKKNTSQRPLPPQDARDHALKCRLILWMTPHRLETTQLKLSQFSTFPTRKMGRNELNNRMISQLKLFSNSIRYAQVRKEVPSRPVRRKRSTKSLGERQFATMPHMKRDEDTPPPRPVRNYSTIIPSLPSKPPRRKSAGSLVEISK
jgi:hypothetical protein